MGDNAKVRYGLKNVYYAIITETDDTITYAKPVPLKGAVALNLTAKGDKSEFYADDSLYHGSSINQGYDGTLELALVPDNFKINVLGFKLDKNNVLFEDAAAVPKKIALLFEFMTDKNPRRHVYYNINVSRPNFETTTKTTNIDLKTETLDITISPNLNMLVKASIDASVVSVYNTWYDKVYEFQEPISGVNIVKGDAK